MPTITNFSLTPAVAATGEWINFTWATANATTFTVMPTIAGDDQALPLQASPFTDTAAPSSTTTFQATASSTVGTSQPSSATLTIVPMTLTATPTTVTAGGTVQLSYSGPNNSSTAWTLTANGGNPVPLTPSTCTGNTCTGTYTTGAAGRQHDLLGFGHRAGRGTGVLQSVIVTVEQPTTLTFTAQPQTSFSRAAPSLCRGRRRMRLRSASIMASAR